MGNSLPVDGIHLHILPFRLRMGSLSTMTGQGSPVEKTGRPSEPMPLKSNPVKDLDETGGVDPSRGIKAVTAGMAFCLIERRSGQQTKKCGR